MKPDSPLADKSCPSPDEIAAFTVGDVSAEMLELLSSHFESCQECEAILLRVENETQDFLTNELDQFAEQCGSNGLLDTTISKRVPDHLIEIGQSVLSQTDSKQVAVSFDTGRRMAERLRAGVFQLGRFELQTELGVGAYGHVFRARDTELDRPVALKVLRAGSFATNEDTERFVREARSVAQLKHPGIVSIYDTVRHDGEICYLVTEYVEGQSLDSWIGKQENLPAEEAARLVAEIADALQYAHEHGIVHRDIKPSNILVDLECHPHVMDFGLAKREFDIGNTVTSDGRVMGTPAYMSPEQARGLSREVDARSDIYSLGVVLYELLTGERPFQGNRRMLLLQVIEDDPRPPRLLEPGVPGDMETICLKSLAKQPTQRYSSAAAFAADLRRFCRGEPIKARRFTVLQRFWRWCKRYPIAATLLLAVPSLSFAGFAYLTWLSSHFVRNTALESVRMESRMLEEINEFYSEEVVGHLDRDRVRVTHEYASAPDAVPLPFTFMIDVGQRITENQSGMSVRMYSNYPWREQGGPNDQFEKQALKQLEQRAISGDLGDRSYHQFAEVDGTPVLKFASAQIMRESCVQCHNDHNQSPKKDWKIGDLAGVLAITRPLERDIANTRSGLRSAFNIMGVIAFGFTCLSLVLLWTARQHAAWRREQI